MSTPQMFWTKIDSSAGEHACWLWRGSVNKHGYGTLKFKSAYTYAHRLAWELTYGKIENPDLVVMHKCDVPLCCNPNHLLLGTVADNNADMFAKGRANRNAPKPKGFASHRSKLTPEQVSAILDRISGGYSQEVVAREFGVAQSTISRISLGISYSDAHSRAMLDSNRSPNEGPTAP